MGRQGLKMWTAKALWTSAAVIAIALLIARAGWFSPDERDVVARSAVEVAMLPGSGQSTAMPSRPDGDASAGRVDSAVLVSQEHSLEELTPVANAHRELAMKVHQKLQNQTYACRSVQEDLLSLLEKAPESDSVWVWAMSRAERCLRAPARDRLGRDFLEALADLKPEHLAVKRQLGLSAYDAGDVREAIHQLQPAAVAVGGFETWETLADARLLLARELTRSGDPDGALRQSQLASQAAQAALEEASPAQLPFALHTMARAEIDLGNPVLALQWAERAIQAAAGVPQASQQARMIPDLHLFVGQIYFRAGQREAGLAYMNQGIAMSQSPQQGANLERIRDQFLRDLS